MRDAKASDCLDAPFFSAEASRLSLCTAIPDPLTLICSGRGSSAAQYSERGVSLFGGVGVAFFAPHYRSRGRPRVSHLGTPGRIPVFFAGFVEPIVFLGHGDSHQERQKLKLHLGHALCGSAATRI